MRKVYETVLSAEKVKEITDWVEGIEVDCSELPSYHYDKDPYGVGPELRGWSGKYVWDEDEEFESQCDEAIEYLKEEGVEAFFDVDDDELTLFDSRDDELVDEYIRIVEALRNYEEIKTKGE